MKNSDNKRIRHPKGPFALIVVYSFTGASILASIIFSLLLFLSIDNDPWMQFLFGSLAVIFELGKFFAWYEFGERLARRNVLAALSAFTFYSILAAISIGGSIGGINSATNTAQRHVDVQHNTHAAYNLQIEAIEKQIDLNNLAAQKYIDLNRIATGVSRIQKENEKLRKQQLVIAIERDNLPVANQGSALGLIGSIATALNIDAKTAQLGLVVFLSVLLDLFAAFFVGLIGEELRFSRTLRANPHTVSESPEPAALQPAANLTKGNDSVRNESEALVMKAVAQLNNGVRCSKKALSSALSLTGEETDQLFAYLLQQGLVVQKPNRHFVWQGNSQSINKAA